MISHAAVLWVGWASVVVQVALTIYGWIRIPAGARVAIHWNLRWEPNGYAPKPVALVLIPAIAALIVFMRSRSEVISYPAFGALVEIGVFVILALAQAAIVFSAIR